MESWPVKEPVTFGGKIIGRLNVIKVLDLVILVGRIIPVVDFDPDQIMGDINSVNSRPITDDAGNTHSPCSVVYLGADLVLDGDNAVLTHKYLRLSDIYPRADQPYI